MIRLIGPVLGTPESSLTRAASFAKLTLAKNGLTSPRRNASAWARSRHHRAWTAAPTAESASVNVDGCASSGYGSFNRGPTLTIAAAVGVAPPGVVGVADPGAGATYEPAFASHSPTPTVMRMVCRRGFHAAE